MAVFDESFQHQLSRQSWILYSIGVFLIALRLSARIHRVGYRELAADDFLMLLAASWYTVLIVCLNVIAGDGGSNLFLPEEYATFSEQDIKDRIHGSKIVIVSEQAMLNVIYTLKVCLLVMYSRLTNGIVQHRLVQILSLYVVCGWISTEIAFFTCCRPFSGYWAVPPPDPQCATLAHYAIIQACFNLSSDLGILVVPIPMITKLSMPLKQRFILGFVFSMGIFVIIAAILTKVYNLSDVYDTSYMLWYTREASVAVYVANLPMIWPLLREWLPFLRNLSSGKNSHLHPSRYYAGGTRLRDVQASTWKQGTLRGTKYSRNGSFSNSPSENVLTKGDIEVGMKSIRTTRSGSPASSERALNPGDIRADVRIVVARESVEDTEGMGDSERRARADALTWIHATATGPTTEVSISGPSRHER